MAAHHHPSTPPPAAPAHQPQLAEFTSLPTPELIARYARGVEQIDRAVLKLTDQQLDMAFLPSTGVGRWPVRVLLGHLADAELAFVHRMRRVVGEDQPVFNPWDEESFIDRGIYGTSDPAISPAYPPQPVAAFIATIHTLRRWNSEWLGALRPEDWSRRGLHTVRGEQTLRTIADYATWHIEHHNWFLRRKLERFGATSDQH